MDKEQQRDVVAATFREILADTGILSAAIDDESRDVMRVYLELLEEHRKGTSVPISDIARDKIAELRSELHKTRIERDQAKLEVLPPGWYWDVAPGEVRARNIDGITFCAPPVGPQLRAIGVIPPAVQMGVGLRATRLAVKPEPPRWGVLLDEGEGGEQFTTHAAALEYGQDTAVHEFWVGPLQRARASKVGCDIDDLRNYVNQLTENGIFDVRPGAQAIFDVVLDAMFGSGYWTIDTTDANRHTVDTKPAEPAEAAETADPPVCSGIGTVSVS